MSPWMMRAAFCAVLFYIHTAAALPQLSIQADAASLAEGGPVALSIALASDDHAGVEADWWIGYLATPDWVHLGLGPTGFAWQSGLASGYQGPLFDLPSVALPPLTGLPPAEYTFYFAVDMRMNGMFDADYFSLASVTVNLAPAAPSARVRAEDFEYLGAFRLPGGEDRPLTFAYGGNAMSFNPDGPPASSGAADTLPGSLFITGHDRIAYGDVPDGDQVAEISIPAPVISRNLEDLPSAEFIQDFHDVLAGRFTDLEEIPTVGLAYLNHPLTGAKLHVVWGQHLQLQDAASHAWVDADLTNHDFQGTWFLGNQNMNSVNGYALTLPTAWADAHTGGRYLASGRMRDGGQGGMGPTLFAYRPWQEDGSAPSDGTRLAEVPLLRYADVTEVENENIERALNGYQHADEWEGADWITTSSGKSALLFAGTKATGDKYWYGYRHPDGPQYPCVDPHFTDFTTCRTASGDACPAQDFSGCCDEGDDTCMSYRGWWSTRFDAQFILYDPADLAEVAAGSLEPWQPQPYATLDIDEHLYLDPPEWEVIAVGSGEQRRYRIAAAAYGHGTDLLYVLEQLADGGKPVVHVWRVH